MEEMGVFRYVPKKAENTKQSYFNLQIAFSYQIRVL